MLKITLEEEMVFRIFMEELEFFVQVFILGMEEEESTLVKLVFQFHENGWNNRYQTMQKFYVFFD